MIKWLTALIAILCVYSHAESHQVVMKKGAKWASNTIPIYYEKAMGPISTANMDEVEKLFMSTWGYWGNVDLQRKSNSTSGSEGIVIHFELDPATKMFIAYVKTNSDGMINRVDVYVPPYWDTDQSAVKATYGIDANASLEAKRGVYYEVMTHELGHALGFGHEFLYFDLLGKTPPEYYKPCIDAAKAEEGTISSPESYEAIGVFDPMSVMNYFYGFCNDKENFQKQNRFSWKLSIGDVAMVRELYGARAAHAAELSFATIAGLKQNSTLNLGSQVAIEKAYPNEDFSNISFASTAQTAHSDALDAAPMTGPQFSSSPSDNFCEPKGLDPARPSGAWCDEKNDSWYVLTDDDNLHLKPVPTTNGSYYPSTYYYAYSPTMYTETIYDELNKTTTVILYLDPRWWGYGGKQPWGGVEYHAAGGQHGGSITNFQKKASVQVPYERPSNFYPVAFTFAYTYGYPPNTISLSLNPVLYRDPWSDGFVIKMSDGSSIERYRMYAHLAFVTDRDHDSWYITDKRFLLGSSIQYNPQYRGRASINASFLQSMGSR